MPIIIIIIIIIIMMSASSLQQQSLARRGMVHRPETPFMVTVQPAEGYVQHHS